MGNAKARETVEIISIMGNVCRVSKVNPAAEVFTTGQVARICKVATKTAAKWFDSGQLKGYRIPGSTDRRIPRASLVKFLKDNGIPSSWIEEANWKSLLCIGVEPILLAKLHLYLTDEDGYRFRAAPDGFAAGVQARNGLPCPVVLIDLTMGRSEALTIAARLREEKDYAEATFIAIVGEDETLTVQLAERGITSVLLRPFDPALLAQMVREAFDNQ